MKTLLFHILIVCLALTGCTTLRTNYRGPDKGMAIVTVTGNTGDPIVNYTLQIRKRDKSAQGGVIYLPHEIFNQTPCDFEEYGYHGFVKVLYLEPGEYEVFNFSLSRRSGIVYSAKKDFSKSFVIRQGENIYIGEYWFASKRTKDFMGTSYHFYITISDRSERDIPLAIKKEPAIIRDTVKVQIPEGERIVN